MQLRRFTGDSTTKTLEQVRSAFGDEAIILSNRSVDGRVEIIATGTLDERALAEAPPAEAAVSPTAAAVRGAAAPADTAAPAEAQVPLEPGAPPITPWTPPTIAPFAVEADTANPNVGEGDASSIDALSRDLAALSTEDAVPLTLGESSAEAGVTTLAFDATTIGSSSHAVGRCDAGAGAVRAVAAPSAPDRAGAERTASAGGAPRADAFESDATERLASARAALEREGGMRVAPVRVVPMPNAPERGGSDRAAVANGSIEDTVAGHESTAAGAIVPGATPSDVPGGSARCAVPGATTGAGANDAAVSGAPVADEGETPPARSLEAGAAERAPGGALEQVLAGAERRHERRAARLETRLRRLEVNLWGEIEPIKAAHLRQLLKLGIGAELAIRLVERIAPGSSAERAMRRSLALLKSTLPIGVDETGRQPGVTVLSGPAGGGKTTSLIKLAAEQVRREGAQSLVMIAAANHRIGAFESLQVYGRLLGVPTVQARDAEELASLVAAFAHKSLVLVDDLPPGSGERLMPSLRAALGRGEGGARTLRHLLVLPATLESRAFEARVAGHAVRGITHALLTQLDRSARLGTCFAPLVRHRLPIAYWSDNARVQTPLERADASVLVATAMATGGRVAASVDEDCLLSLLQPTRRDVGEPLSVDAACADVAGEVANAADRTDGTGAIAWGATVPVATPTGIGGGPAAREGTGAVDSDVLVPACIAVEEGGAYAERADFAAHELGGGADTAASSSSSPASAEAPPAGILVDAEGQP